MTSRSSSRGLAILCVGVAVAVVAAFSPTLSAGFVYWDDDKNFLEHSGWRGLSFEHLRWMATTFHGGPYQPLSWFSLAIDHALWGMNPAALHATNVALHAATAITFLFFARELFSLATPAMANTTRDLAAAAAALFFAIHPLRTESVAWITERRDVLSGLFYVLSLLFYVRAAGRTDRRKAWLSLSVGAFLLGLLSKASGMTLPLVLILLDLWPLKRSMREAWREKLLFAIPAVAFALVAYLGQASLPHSLRTIGDHGGGERLAQAAYAAVFYPMKTLVPLRLSPIYELPDRLDPMELRFLSAIGLALAATLLSFCLRRSIPAVWTAWAAFLAILAPVSGIVQSGPQLVADRYSYLACMPFALLLAGALFSRWPRGAPVVAFGLAGILGVLTWRQSFLWRDTETLFVRALEIDPESPIAHDVVARMLALRGRPADAAIHYRRAIEIDPDRPIPRNNLGLLLLKHGSIEEAIFQFREALRVQPDYARARTNLGAALLQRGDAEEAEAVLREALQRDARDLGARTNLAQALLAQDRAEEAVAELTSVLAVNARSPEAHAGLAQAYTKLGRADLAREHLRQARALREGQ